jgi:hypothetical protein
MAGRQEYPPPAPLRRVHSTTLQQGPMASSQLHPPSPQLPSSKPLQPPPTRLHHVVQQPHHLRAGGPRARVLTPAAADQLAQPCSSTAGRAQSHSAQTAVRQVAHEAPGRDG